MALSDTIKRISKPGRYRPIEIFIGGAGQSFQRDFQILVSGSPEPLSGVTPSAEIRSLDDNLLVEMICSVTDAVNGWVSMQLTRQAADAISWPDDGPKNGNRALRGRWHLRLDDGVTSMPIACGDVWVTR